MKKLKKPEPPRYRREEGKTKIQILIFLSDIHPRKATLGEIHSYLKKISKRKFQRMNTKKILHKLISEDLVKEFKNGFGINKRVVDYNKKHLYEKWSESDKYFYFIQMFNIFGIKQANWSW